MSGQIDEADVARTTLIIAPNGESSAALRYAYRGRDDVKVAPITGITGHRGDIIVVLPLPASASDAERQSYERIMLEQIETKAGPGVRLIIL